MINRLKTTNNRLIKSPTKKFRKLKNTRNHLRLITLQLTSIRHLPSKMTTHLLKGLTEEVAAMKSK